MQDVNEQCYRLPFTRETSLSFQFLEKNVFGEYATDAVIYIFLKKLTNT